MPAYKDNVTGKWYAKFYCKNWRGENKQIKKRGFDTKREALEYERHYKIREEENLDMTFGDFFKLYTSDMEVRLKHNTWLSKEHVVRTKILPFFQDMKMNEISPSDIVKWQNEMIAFQYGNGKGYSETYRKTMHNQLSCIFNHACRFYGLKTNPARLAGNMGKEETKEMLFWTKEEYRKFSEAIMDNEVAFYAFEMLYWTGIRCGELLALSKSDFNLSKRTLRINKNYQVIKGKEIVTSPKTEKSNRVIELPQFLCEEMQDYFDSLYKVDENSRIFEVTKSYLHHEMDRGAKAAGVKRIRIHDLRHSSCALLIELGYSPVQIAERLGHESVTITERYAHLYPSVQRQMADRLDDAFKDEEETDD